MNLLLAIALFGVTITCVASSPVLENVFSEQYNVDPIAQLKEFLEIYDDPYVQGILNGFYATFFSEYNENMIEFVERFMDNAKKVIDDGAKPDNVIEQLDEFIGGAASLNETLQYIKPFFQTLRNELASEKKFEPNDILIGKRGYGKVDLSIQSLLKFAWDHINGRIPGKRDYDDEENTDSVAIIQLKQFYVPYNQPETLKYFKTIFYPYYFAEVNKALQKFVEAFVSNAKKVVNDGADPKDLIQQLDDLVLTIEQICSNGNNMAEFSLHTKNVLLGTVDEPFPLFGLLIRLGDMELFKNIPSDIFEKHSQSD